VQRGYGECLLRFEGANMKKQIATEQSELQGGS